MGTNVDCYQRAEGRYQLMPGIIAALRDARNPFSILTKGTLLLRDLDLIEEAAQVTSVALNMSVGFCRRRAVRVGRAWHSEPATAARRLRGDHRARNALRDPDGPVLPFLTDAPGQLADTVRQIAAAVPPA